MAKIPAYYSTEDLDNEPVNFGKYRGELSPMDILETDPGYIVWTWEKAGRRDFCSEELYNQAVVKWDKKRSWNRIADFNKGE